jgi:hypothetical protein
MPKNPLDRYCFTQDQANRAQAIRDAGAVFFAVIQQLAPASAEQTLARRAIEEATFRALQAIALNEPTRGEDVVDAFCEGLSLYVAPGEWLRPVMTAGADRPCWPGPRSE